MADEIKIEKGIPIPVRRGRTGIMAVLRSMEVGDSAVVPDKISNISGRVAWLRPRKYTMRSVEGGCRVWRVE